MGSWGVISERYHRANLTQLAVAAALSAGLSIALVHTAHATIIAQVGPQSFGVVTASEDFESFGAFANPGNPFSGGGLTFALPGGGSFVIWPGPGGPGFPTQSAYDNGGSGSMLAITLAGGADFQQVQFDVGNGFANTAFTNYIWLRIYNNGAPTGFDFDFDGIAINPFQPATLSVWTDGLSQFDEVRVASYHIAAVRNAHDEGSYSATSVDNVVAQSVANVPEPGSLTLLASGFASLAFIAVARRRKTHRSVCIG